MHNKVDPADLFLKELRPEDVTDKYVAWMNDPQTNRYLESRDEKHTLKGIREYVLYMLQSEDDYLYGIFYGNEHVGNIKLGSLHHRYRRADIGLVIDKSYWGQGVGTRAIFIVEQIAFKEKGLHKLEAGIYEENKGSLNAFLKNGWVLVGKYEDHALVEARYTGCYIVEKLNPYERQ